MESITDSTLKFQILAKVPEGQADYTNGMPILSIAYAYNLSLIPRLIFEVGHLDLFWSIPFRIIIGKI